MKQQVLTRKTVMFIFMALIFIYNTPAMSWVPFEFVEGDTTTREIAENTPKNTYIGAPLRYTPEVPDNFIGVSINGPDWRSFDVARVAPGSLQLMTKARLNYEKKNAYEIRVTVFNWGSPASDTITVNVTVTNVNEAPMFIAGDAATRLIDERASIGSNVGEALSATDEDTDDVLVYSLLDADLNVFEINSSTGQLRTKAALDYETKPVYTMTVLVSDGTLTDSIILTVLVLPEEETASAPAMDRDRTDFFFDLAALKTLDRKSVQEQLRRLRSHNDGSLKYQQAIALLENILESRRPDKTVLLANYPNPFNPETWIPYRLAKAAHVQINIYDAHGIAVRHLELGHQSSGYYTSPNRAAYWDGKNDFGECVSSGIYFYQLQADTVSPLRKMVILK